MNFKLISGIVAAFAGTLATAATAATFMLEDLNATAVFETQASASGAERSGLVSWTTNTGPGEPAIVEQSIWLRVGNETRERPMASYNVTFAQATDTNPNSGADTFVVQYTQPNSFQFLAEYSLQGTFCCGSDMGEQFSLRKIGQGSQTFSLFLYTEFNAGAPEILERLNPNTFSHDGSRWLTETVLTPAPTFWEINEASVLRAKLTDDVATTLSNTVGMLTGSNLAWAGQWNFTLGENQTFQLSVDKRIAPIPLPAPAFLLLGGLGALAAMKRRAA